MPILSGRYAKRPQGRRRMWVRPLNDLRVTNLPPRSFDNYSLHGTSCDHSTLTVVTVCEIPECIGKWGQTVFRSLPSCFSSRCFRFLQLETFVEASRGKLTFQISSKGGTVKLAFKTPSRCIKPRHSRLNINLKIAVLPLFAMSSYLRTRNKKHSQLLICINFLSFLVQFLSCVTRQQ